MNETTKTNATTGGIGLGGVALICTICLILLRCFNVITCAVWLCFLPVIIWGGLIVLILLVCFLIMIISALIS